MAGGNVYSASDLRKTFLILQGQKIGWDIASSVLFDYCTGSLAPIGLVAKEALNPDLSAYGYQITDYGRKVGIPFCGLMLDWSRKHGISLNMLWGSTNSSSRPIVVRTIGGEELEFKKRAPITTLKMLYELVTAPNLPIRETDLANMIGETQESVYNHLVRLTSASLLEYQATETNKPYSAYKLLSSQPINEIPIYRGYKSLTWAVFAVLQAYPDQYLTINNVHQLIPQRIKEHLSVAALYLKITHVLAHLRRNNCAEIYQFSMKYQSEINLNDHQRIILTELLEIIDQFQSQDPEIVTKGRKLAIEIINNPTIVSDILSKYREQSPSANRAPVLETMAQINYLISSNPGITNKEIQQLLNQGGKKLGSESITKMTSALIGKGSILFNKEGNLKRFFPKEPSIS